MRFSLQSEIRVTLALTVILRVGANWGDDGRFELSENTRRYLHGV